ncbi:MAG: twin-arginine translocase TatA/TatE family subunit [Actinomycetota bacterium]|nr:twin-arginine translocase TatA/TatE family subunit [Actinomycetota bacterium]
MVEPSSGPRLSENLKCVVTRKLSGYISVVFGIGPQELVLIGLLALVIFGPTKLPQMARDLGRFVTEARRSVDEFKDELILDEDEDENRRPKRKH